MLAASVLVIARPRQGLLFRSSKSHSGGLGLFTAQVIFRKVFSNGLVKLVTLKFSAHGTLIYCAQKL